MRMRDSEYVGGQSCFNVDIPHEDVSVNVVDTDDTLYVQSGDTYKMVSSSKKSFKVIERDTLSVQVDLVVEKESYDDAADECQSAIEALTGSVAAVQSHQIAEIRNSGKRITKTITDGFFGLVKSEISQQMTEQEKKIESLSGRLMELTRLLDKQRVTMEEDYASISSRYIKVFKNLDEDYNHRIRILNKHAFEIKETSDSLRVLPMGTFGGVGTLLDAAEEPKLQSQLTASAMRKRIHESIGSIYTILSQEQAYENYMNAVTHKGVMDTAYDFAPVMTVNFVSLENTEEVLKTYVADAFSGERKKAISDAVLNQVDTIGLSISKEEKKHLDKCFDVESEKWMSQTDAKEREKNRRVLAMVNKMWQKNSQG